MKNTKPKIKLSRQLGIPLTSKAIRYMERKPHPPGEHGQTRKRSKSGDYKKHLMEKQRLQAQYNIAERQMRIYILKAMQPAGNPEKRLFGMLERRLDAFVYRAGLARTMAAARQYVNHRHILVNGKWVNIPSFQIKAGDLVSVKEKSRELPCFLEVAEEMVTTAPAYIERSREQMHARLIRLPEREEVPVSCDLPLVIEFYKR